MTATWREVVRPVVEAIRREEGVSGFLIAVVQGDGGPEYLALGDDAAGCPLAADTLFPIASITKLATALAVLRLVAAGKLGLDDPLGVHLPDAAAARDAVTLRALMCHTSGLPDDLPVGAAPYDASLSWPVLARACLATQPVRPPWTKVVYSNVGAGLLAVVVERLTGRSFSGALSELVLTPLGIEGYLGEEPPREPARVAGDLGEHAGTDLEPFNSPFWRRLALPWGGMVSTAAGALALTRVFAGVPAGFLPPDLLAEARRDQTRGLAGEMAGLFDWPRCPWGLGIELRGDKTPHWAPSEAGPSSFGHAGASGCLAWVDPVTEVAWAMFGPCTVERWYRRFPEVGAAVLAATS